MVEQIKERLQPAVKTIELAFTPFSHRFNQFLKNNIEDEITSLTGRKFRGIDGTIDFSDTEADSLYRDLSRIIEIADLYHTQRQPFLIMDGAFQSLVKIQMFRKTGIISQEQARLFTQQMLQIALREDLIIVTLLDVYAARSRVLYPIKLGKYKQVMQGYHILFSYYNQTAEEILAEHTQDFKKIEVLRLRESEFNYGQIYFQNYQAILNEFGLSPLSAGEIGRRAAVMNYIDKVWRLQVAMNMGNLPQFKIKNLEP